jgi:phage gp36-like protein
MSYASKSDIELHFGDRNVAIWSNLDNTDAAANDARITEALTYADADIDDRFRNSRYAVPFSPVPTKVKEWSAKLAGIWLFESRPGKREENTTYVDMKRDIADEIDLYLVGSRQLDATLNDADSPTAPIAV